MDISPAALLNNTAPDAARNPVKLKQATQDFEALLIAQMLRTARETGSGGWLGSGEDSPSSTAMEFAEQQLATMMAQGGGLGLAKLVESSVRPPANPAPATAPAPKE